MDKYNRTLDSIGTEMSYSETSDMPRSQQTMNTNFNTKNTNSTQTNQIGSGGFLDFLFPENDKNKKITQNSAEFTKMIMSAIETGRYQAADFLLEQPFVPDLTVLNQKGESLMHLL